MNIPSLAELDKLADDLLKSDNPAPMDGDKQKPEQAPAPAPEDIAEPTPGASNPDEQPPKEEPKEPPKEKPGEEGKEPPTEPVEKGCDGCGDGDKLKKGKAKGAFAKLLKKGEDEPPAEEGEPPAEEPTEPTAEEDKEQLAKSIQADFQQVEDIRKGMDASEFLTSVVEILSKSLGDVLFEVQSNGQDSQATATVLGKSLQAALMQNTQMADELAALRVENAELKKSISEGFDGLSVALNQFMTQPATMRKSVDSIHVMDRNFGKSLDTGADGFESLSKSQVMAVLNQELYKGNPSVQPTDIIGYESGAPLRPELRQLVMNASRA